MNEIIIFLVIRNESEYLIELLQYYLGLGVDKFIILDDNSTDITNEILNPFINKNIVHYFKEKVSKYCKLHRLKYYNLFKDTYHNNFLLIL